MGRLSIDLLSMSHEIGVADAEDSISVIHFNIKLRSQAEHVNEPSSFSLVGSSLWVWEIAGFFVSKKLC